MKKVDFLTKWALRVFIIVSLVYTLIKGHWVGTAGGAIVLLITFLVDYINEKWFKIAPIITSTVYIFCIFSLVMGTMWRFYDIFSWWDLLMHLVSGVILAVIGNYILNILLNGQNISPLARFLFLIGMACLGGIVWEIYEFTVDSWFNLDTQMTLTTGVGDTMGDLITDLVGGILGGGFLTLFSKK